MNLKFSKKYILKLFLVDNFKKRLKILSKNNIILDVFIKI